MLHTYRLLAERRIPGFSVQVGEGSGPPVDTDELCYSEHVLGTTISRLPDPSQGRHAAGRRTGFTDIGPLVFAPANVPWYIRSGGGRYRYIKLAFDRGVFSRITDHTDDWHERELKACNDVKSTRIQHMLRRLGEEAATPSFAADMLLDALGTTILIDLSRYFADVRQPRERSGKVLELWQIRRLRDYVEALTGAAPRLSDMAGLCGVSNRSLIRLFRASTGQTISAYVQERQLVKAKRLLAERDLALKEISFRLGFSSPSSFSYAFRKATSETPSQFRERCAKGA